jgi:hypothetical protein
VGRGCPRVRMVSGGGIGIAMASEQSRECAVQCGIGSQ